MAITAKWHDDEKTIIYATFTGKWTIDEFSQVIDDIRTMIQEVDHPVWAVADGDDSKGLPRQGNVIPHFQRLFSLEIEHFAIVPSSNLTRMVLTTFLRLNAKWNNRITFIEKASDGVALVESLKAKI